jgi:hypothetical protein
MRATGLDDQQIKSAVRSHLVPRGRTEQNDPVRVRHFDNSASDFVEKTLVSRHAVHRCVTSAIVQASAVHHPYGEPEKLAP